MMSRYPGSSLCQIRSELNWLFCSNLEERSIIELLWKVLCMERPHGNVQNCKLRKMPEFYSLTLLSTEAVDSG